MKFKALLLVLAVAGAGASFGLTDSGRSDTGTSTAASTTAETTTTDATTTSSDGCNRFELRGTLASVSAQSFSVNVTKGDEDAKGLAGTTVTIAVSADTRVSWSGRGTLTGPNAGDTVSVNGKQCGTTLTASKVAARGPGKDGKHGDAGSDGNGAKQSDGKQSDGKKK